MTVKSTTGIEYQVWWIPQVPMKPFLIDVPDFETGLLLCKVLADYDLFQYRNKVKPDYSNAGGLRYRFRDRHNPTDDGVTEDDWEEVDVDDETEVIEHRQRIANAGCDLLWSVDHDDGVPAGGKVNLIARVQTQRLAEILIEGIMDTDDPDGVVHGRYGICGPQEG